MIELVLLDDFPWSFDEEFDPSAPLSFSSFDVSSVLIVYIPTAPRLITTEECFVPAGKNPEWTRRGFDTFS